MNTIVYKIRHKPSGKFFKKHYGTKYIFSNKGKIWYRRPQLFDRLNSSDLEIVQFNLVPCK